MGLRETLRSVLGLSAEREATRGADPDDLFGMSTAYVTMEADLGYEPAGTAALCFADVDSTDFAEAVETVRAILDAGEEETGTVADFREDSHGYQWIVLEDETFEELVTTIHFASKTLIDEGFGSRLLAAVFPFVATDTARAETGTRVYWVYSFRRGTYYPFVPQPDQQRDNSVEFKLASVLDGELTVEDDEAYWYPLWPDTPSGHPWE